MNIIEKDNKYLLPVYGKFPLEIVKGKGSYIWDSEGKKYLDFYGGHAVCILGHCFEPVVDAVKSQAEELVFYSNVFYTAPAVELAEKLAGTMPGYQVYFTNSGSEANETAIKIARKHTGKKRIVSFKGAFHGRALTNIAVTGIDAYHKYEPNLDEFTSFAELGDMDSVKAACDADTAAVILEPIQSIGGINIATEEFYIELAEYCKAEGILLIWDEVQTGLGRTGEFWTSSKLEPSMITSAKGIASGLPLSVVMVSPEVAAGVEKGDHATTYGGGPIPCAAGNAVVDTLLNDGFADGVKEKSAYIKEQLEGVVEVIGEGLLLGLKFPEAQPDLVKKCLEAGLIIGSSMKKEVVRITPPLNITKEEIDEFVSILKSVLS